MTRGDVHGFVLDTWAVIAYLQGEPSSEIIGDIVGDAMKDGIPVYMSIINVGEMWYITAREISSEDADSAVAGLKKWGVEFVGADWNMVREAAVLKSKHKISYADAFAAALALSTKATLVTGDKEFEPFEKFMRVKWLR